MTTIWHIIRGIYCMLAVILMRGASLSNKTIRRFKHLVVACVVLFLSMICLTGYACYSQNASLMIFTQISLAIFFLIAWYGGRVAASAVGIINNNLSNDIKEEITVLFSPICTLSLVCTFIAFWVAVNGFDALDTRTFLVIITVVCFFAVSMVYYSSKTKWAGGILTFCVFFMLFQFAFPEKYQCINRFFYSSGQYAESKIDEKSKGLRDDAAAIYTHVEHKGVLYEMDKATSTGKYVSVGQRVKIVGIKNVSKEENGEPMQFIMLPNKDGDFLPKGKVYAFPSWKLGINLRVSDIKKNTPPSTKRGKITKTKIYRPSNSPYTIVLKAGETTDYWLIFPTDRKYAFNLSSDDYKYIVTFDDGTSYNCWEISEFPYKAEAKFTITAVTYQHIKLEVS